MFQTRMLAVGMGLALTASACEMKKSVQNSPGSPGSGQAGTVTQPEGSSGTTREALPADGAAATGYGVTTSNTSAASGAVNIPDNSNPVPAGTEAPMAAQPGTSETTSPTPSGSKP